MYTEEAKVKTASHWHISMHAVFTGCCSACDGQLYMIRSPRSLCSLAVTLCGLQLHSNAHSRRFLSMLQIACQVWFWRFRSPHNEIVRERLAKQSVAQAAVTRLNKHRAAVMSEAKSQLGLWSDAGIEESRETFWCDNVILDKVVNPCYRCSYLVLGTYAHAP